MRSRVLAVVSGAQLALGLVGLRTALRRRHAYDFLWLRGDAAHVARDAVTMGTALSAPGPMLVAQGVATGTVALHPDRRAERILGVLGAAMVAGYLGERLVRTRLTPAGWEPLESTVVVAGLGLAAAMAVLGLRPPRG